MRGQRALIADALKDASVERLEATLDGTIGDAQAFCWGALRQFDRHAEPTSFTSPRDFGLQHADLHYLLIGAQEAVSHAGRVEPVLAALGRQQQLPPTQDMRERLRQMRNLLAEHRDERVLYWRLTGEHTPHVMAIYERFGMPAIKGTIDSYEYGTEIVGGILSLRDLHSELLALSDELGELALTSLGAPGTPLRRHLPAPGDSQPAFGVTVQLRSSGGRSIVASVELTTMIETRGGCAAVSRASSGLGSRSTTCWTTWRRA